MSSKTTNYNMHKIDLADSPPDITVLNQNFDKIDAEMHKQKTDFTTHLDKVKKSATPEAIVKRTSNGLIVMPFYYCMLKRVNSYTIPNETPTAIPWEVELSDGVNMFVPTENTKIYARTTGVYLLSLNLLLGQSVANTPFEVIVKINGQAKYPVSGTGVTFAGNNTGFNVNKTFELMEGDYIEIVVSQKTGNSLSLVVWSDTTTCNLHLLQPITSEV